MKTDDIKKGPSTIINSGITSSTTLSNPNKYGKYSLVYTVDENNLSFQALNGIVSRLIFNNTDDLAGVKLPWKKDEETGKMKLIASCRKRPAVVDSTKRVVQSSSVRDGDYIKMNVTPMYWEMDDKSSVLMPDGSRNVIERTNKGVTLILNGVMLMCDQEKEEEDLF